MIFKIFKIFCHHLIQVEITSCCSMNLALSELFTRYNRLARYKSPVSAVWTWYCQKLSSGTKGTNHYELDIVRTFHQVHQVQITSCCSMNLTLSELQSPKTKDGKLENCAGFFMTKCHGTYRSFFKLLLPCLCNFHCNWLGSFEFNGRQFIRSNRY